MTAKALIVTALWLIAAALLVLAAMAWHIATHPATWECSVTLRDDIGNLHQISGHTKP